MKNKLGLISGLILSLVIAGSVFANDGKTTASSTKSSNSLVKVVKSKELTQKKHHKHKKSKRHNKRQGKRHSKKNMKRSPSPVK